jgi:hypothetical protein
MRYARDPHWVVARRPGTCAGCGTPFEKGEEFLNRTW